MPLLMVLLWFFGAVALLAISFAFIKSMCDGPPSNRTTPAAAAANTTTTTNNNNNGLTAGAAASHDVLSTLPVFVYSLAAQKKKLNCSVCLMDFKEGEKGRFLPRCFHCFHVECIDVWLASHLVCPVCRASVDPEAPDLAAV